LYLDIKEGKEDITLTLAVFTYYYEHDGLKAEMVVVMVCY
jgi:hypothetical protein